MDSAIVQAPYRVISLERRTATIAELWLRPLDGALRFLPGEYVLLEDVDGAVAPRSYSIANAPRSDGLLSLLVTRVPGGQASTWVHGRLRIGDEVMVDGPYGTFVDDPTRPSPCLLLAAGSGLAPMRALVEAAMLAGTRRSLTLIFSARAAGDVIDGVPFCRLQEHHPQFRFIRTLTRAAGPPPNGRIPALLRRCAEDLGDHDVYIAGAAGFVAACAKAAQQLGATSGRIHTEAFFVEQ
jgi:CDP-4-dehydro-6-deoxyglucose reductase